MANTIPCNIDLISGKYKVDGKSIMGVFSLDLSKPVSFTIDNENDDNNDEYIEKFRKAGFIK